MNTDVRLISDGSSTSEKMGTVELCTNGEWTSICDNGWDNNDAAVVCAQLGFSAAGGMSVTCCFYCTNLTYSLTHQLIHSLTHSPTHWSTHPLAHSLTHLTYSLTHPLTHSRSQTLTHSLTHPLTEDPLTHSLTHPPTVTHPLTVTSLTHPLIDFALSHSLGLVLSILHWAIFLTIKLHFITQ